jgi:DNA-binding transcriptional LysR family regulator
MTVRQLARLPLVTLPSGTSTRGLLDRALAAIGTEPVVAVESDQREVLVPLVVAGAGAAVLPRPMADEAALRGAVVVPLHPPLWRDLGVVHRDAVLSPAARAFLDLALRRAQPTE